MAGLFGHTWVSSYGAEPSDTWAQGLADLSDEALRLGLMACLSWESEWPPTLPQFRALCLPRRDECHRIRRAALPEPPESRERRANSARVALRSVREALGPVVDVSAQKAPPEPVSDAVMQRALAELADMGERIGAA